jgi:hypothetical protein
MVAPKAVLSRSGVAWPDAWKDQAGVVAGAVSANQHAAFLRIDAPQLGLLRQFWRYAGRCQLGKID